MEEVQGEGKIKRSHGVECGRGTPRGEGGRKHWRNGGFVRL